MALTVNTAYKSDTVASVSGTTFVSNNTPFVAGDVGRYIRLTSGSGAGEIRRIETYVDTATVTVDYAWNACAISGITEVEPAASDGWHMSYKLDDIDDGTNLIKHNDYLYEHVSTTATTITLQNCFVADSDVNISLDSNRFKLDTTACLQLGYLSPTGYGSRGGAMYDRTVIASGNTNGWSNVANQGYAGDLHLYACNVMFAVPAGNPFWRLYNSNATTCRFVDCNFSGKVGFRLRGTRSCIIRNTFRYANNAVGTLGVIANFGVISDIKFLNCTNGVYTAFLLGVGTVTGPRFTNVTNAVNAGGLGTGNMSGVIEDYIQSEIEACTYAVIMSSGDGSDYIDFKQYITGNIVDADLTAITEEARRVIRNAAETAVDNDTTETGTFDSYTAIVKRFPSGIANYAWDSVSATSYGPYEEAIATYNYIVQRLDLPLETSSDVQFTMLPDNYVTQTTRATVDAYTTIDNLGELYDIQKSWVVTNLALAYPTFANQPFDGDGLTIDLNDSNLVLDPDAAAVFAIVTATSTATVKTGATFAPTEKFTTLKNFDSITIEAGVDVSCALTTNTTSTITSVLAQLLGTITLSGTSTLVISDAGTAPSGTSASGTTVQVDSATADDIFNFSAWTFAEGSVFENNSGVAVVLKLTPGQTVPTLTETSGTITLDNSATVNITLNNLVAGSRVQIYNTDTSAEIDNAIEATTTYTYEFTYSENTNIRIRVMHVDGTTAYKWYTATGTITSAGFTLNVSQELNPVYNLVSIDGSTVTECSVSGATIRIYIDDPDNTTTAQRIYNWYQYLLFTESGIADQDGAYISATDSTHYVFADTMKIINSDTTNPLNITGANIIPTTGSATNIFDLTNGASMALNFERVEGFSYSSGSGLDEAQDAKLTSLYTDLPKTLTTNKFIALK